MNKKHFLPLVACILAASSCNLDDQFSVSNMNDLVTVYSQTLLINDYNTSYTITEDQSDHQWAVGDRLVILFDILNRDYDISLRDYVKCIVSTPTPVPEDQEPSLGEDPVMVNTCTISGGYVNMELVYYVKTGSSFPHRIAMEYQDDGYALNLFLIHEGNGENPATTDKGSLTTVVAPYSFSLDGLAPSGESRKLNLTLNTLSDSNGIEQKSYSLYEGSISF